MSKVICIMGESGSGKTTSMRNLDPKTIYYIDADKKGLSWKGWRKQYNKENKNYLACDDANIVRQYIKRIAEACPGVKVIVVDTVNGLMVADEMRRSKEKGYDKWVDLAACVWDLVCEAYTYRDDLTIIFTAHTQTDHDEAGYMFTRIKTSGKKLDKICLESKFTTVLLSKGYTWRGRMAMKVIEPPAGSDYRVVSGELNAILKKMIEPEFGGLYVVPGTDTGVTVSNYQFDRYCTLLEGITKMLKSVGYRLSIRHKREKGIPGYVLIEAVPVVDHSDEIELSKDCGLNYTMEDKRNGVNHLIVTGKGELQNRNVFHLYVWPDGSFKKTQYYKGLDEIAQVYENTSTETDELESQSTKKLQDLCSKKTFGMDIAKLGIDVGIGDIVGGRDYLTGMYSSKPIENIIYSITNRIESKEYELEGENDNGDS